MIFMRSDAATLGDRPAPTARAARPRPSVSLRLRINVLVTALVVLFALAVGRTVFEDTRSSIKEEIEAGTKVTVQMLSAVAFASQVSGTPRRFVLGFLERLGRVRANHIRLRDMLTGAVVYESPPPVYKAGRDAPDWYARLVTPPTAPVNLDLPGARIEVVPDASRAILDAWDDLKPLLVLGGLFFVVVNVLVFWFVSRSMRPMEQIQRGLAEMESGRLGARLPDFRLPEFRRIGVAFNRMCAALEDATAENRRLALAVRQSSDAILIHDPDGRIAFWNPASERMFGYRAEEVVGKPLELLAPAQGTSDIGLQLDSVRRRVSIENVATRRRTRSGGDIDVAISVTPLLDPEGGAVLGGIATHRDITAQLRAQAAEAELTRNRDLAQAVQAHVEQERRGIAQELHDELAQCVTAIRTIAESIIQRPTAGAADVRAQAQGIKDIAAKTYEGMHAIVRRLRPAELDALGLPDTLRGAVTAWASRHPTIDFRLELEGEIDGVGDAVGVTVYRIVHEAVTNIVRHANATRATVRVTRASDRTLELCIEDNGHGNVIPASGGFGVVGMRERVEALGGALSVDGRPGVGTRLHATIPLSLH